MGRPPTAKDMMNYYMVTTTKEEKPMFIEFGNELIRQSTLTKVKRGKSDNDQLKKQFWLEVIWQSHMQIDSYGFHGLFSSPKFETITEFYETERERDNAYSELRSTLVD